MVNIKKLFGGCFMFVSVSAFGGIGKFARYGMRL